MIHYRFKSDLFETHYYAILHGCNALGVMGSGVAKIVRDEFYDAYEIYNEIYDKHGLRLGQIIPVWCRNPRTGNDIAIINGITQEKTGLGLQVDYNAIDEVFAETVKWAKTNGIKEVAMPAIGAGLGGGEWAKIEPLIKKHFTDIDAIVYLLTDTIPK